MTNPSAEGLAMEPVFLNIVNRTCLLGAVPITSIPGSVLWAPHLRKPALELVANSTPRADEMKYVWR